MVHALSAANNKLINLYFSCVRIRLVEEKIAEAYPNNEMRCPTHLSIGQELVGAVLGLVTEKTDFAFSTHRSHAHYLGKGGDLSRMIAEIYGKQTGCCGGMGGSMHLRDASVGFEASTAIVGNSIPVGVGAAIANKLKQNNCITVVFVGDAVFETGVFYESMNIAATFGAPVLFVCENNLYSVYSPLSVRQPAHRENYKIAAAMGIETGYVDGSKAEDVLTAASGAVNYCREWQKPFLLEASAYRWREHCGPNFDNDLGYRSNQEFENWKKADYLASLKEHLLDARLLTTEEISRRMSEINYEIEDAFSFAKSSPFPVPAEVLPMEFKVPRA